MALAVVLIAAAILLVVYALAVLLTAQTSPY
jgi:hypothetical protein